MSVLESRTWSLSLCPQDLWFLGSSKTSSRADVDTCIISSFSF